MKFLVKHPQNAGQVFLSDRYVGLVADPVFAAKSDALEAYYKAFTTKWEYGKDLWAIDRPAPVISQHGDVTRIQPPE